MQNFLFAAARHRARICAVLLIACSAIVLAVPSAGRAVARIDGVQADELPNFDSRATVAPGAAQLAAASALGASVSWNEFGAAGSVLEHGGYVATGIEATDAASAARAWIDANKALFKLDSTDGARRGDGAAARRHDGRLRGRLPATGERRRNDRRLRLRSASSALPRRGLEGSCTHRRA